ncbi:hypothetical protein ES695_01335 [Candidatus Atribacteria bacterium 1244-E10-H5-B2]|nr:MAG: hypothetical protein ES695_01335 [Candidatus Atribacteria bacterium 1244-E10-H5-B2]
MLVVRILKDNAENFASYTSIVTFESCKRRLRLYFTNLEKVKERIVTGEIIDIPYITFQKDRRVNKKKMFRNERRKNLEAVS